MFDLVDDGIGEDEVASAPASKPSAEQDRRIHQCHHDGCDSPCVWDVYLHIRYGWHLVAIESLKSTIRVCDKHKKHANDFILSDHNKAMISQRLATIGRLAIDWDNAMIEFVPCGEIAWGPSQMVALQTRRA